MFIFQSTREKCEISRFSLGCWSPVMKNWTHQETTVKIMFFFVLSTFPPIFLIYTISIMIHIKTPCMSRVHCFISMWALNPVYFVLYPLNFHQQSQYVVLLFYSLLVSFTQPLPPLLTLFCFSWWVSSLNATTLMTIF